MHDIHELRLYSMHMWQTETLAIHLEYKGTHQVFSSLWPLAQEFSPSSWLNLSGAQRASKLVAGSFLIFTGSLNKKIPYCPGVPAPPSWLNWAQWQFTFKGQSVHWESSYPNYWSVSKTLTLLKCLSPSSLIVCSSLDLQQPVSWALHRYIKRRYSWVNNLSNLRVYKTSYFLQRFDPEGSSSGKYNTWQHTLQNRP